MKKYLLAAGVVALVASVQTASAEKFDLQRVFGLQVPSIGPSPQKWAKRVELMTDGDVEIDVHGAGEFVPPFEVFDAVSSGAIPMGFDWIGYELSPEYARICRARLEYAAAGQRVDAPESTEGPPLQQLDLLGGHHGQR